MNSSAQNKNGFTTFLATLVISLAVFGVLYYLITDFSGKVNIEEAPDVSETEVASAEDKSVFGELSRQKVETPPQRAVLAGADMVEIQSTESTTTVPETGSSGMAIAAVIASTTLVVGSYYVIKGPRKLALNKFEKELIR